MPAEGAKAINQATGETATFNSGQWVKDAQKGAQADAGLKGRLSLGLGPMVSAEQAMEAEEAKGNPFSFGKHPRSVVAKAMGDIELPFIGGRPMEGIANAIGGDDYQRYDQPAAAYESQLMPIMSGAAVSPSEARRQIRAALPALGDTPEQLARKAITRQQMLNGAAKLQSVPLPYPNQPTYGINNQTPPTQQAPAGWTFKGVR